eukprot:Rmarinus@m.12534
MGNVCIGRKSVAVSAAKQKDSGDSEDDNSEGDHVEVTIAYGRDGALDVNNDGDDAVSDDDKPSGEPLDELEAIASTIDFKSLRPKMDGGGAFPGTLLDGSIPEAIDYETEPDDEYYTETEKTILEKPRPQKLKSDSTSLGDSMGKDIAWQQGEVLGVGAFGKVFLGLNDHTGALMAVKEVTVNADNAEHVTTLEEEISVLRQLDHKNIVRYLGTQRNVSESKFLIFFGVHVGRLVSSPCSKVWTVFGEHHSAVHKTNPRWSELPASTRNYSQRHQGGQHPRR